MKRETEVTSEPSFMCILQPLNINNDTVHIYRKDMPLVMLLIS